MKDTILLQIITLIFRELINGKTKAGVWIVVLCSIYLKWQYGLEFGFFGFSDLPGEVQVVIGGAGVTITVGLLHDAWKKLKVIILGISQRLSE